MLNGASPGSGKYQAKTVSASQHVQSEDGYYHYSAAERCSGDPAVFGVFSIRPGRWPIQLLIFQSVCPVFPASAELLRRTPSGPLCWQCEAHTLSDVGCGRMQDTGCFFISRGVR